MKKWTESTTVGATLCTISSLPSTLSSCTFFYLLWPPFPGKKIRERGRWISDGTAVEQLSPPSPLHPRTSLPVYSHSCSGHPLQVRDGERERQKERETEIDNIAAVSFTIFCISSTLSSCIFSFLLWPPSPGKGWRGERERQKEREKETGSIEAASFTIFYLFSTLYSSPFCNCHPLLVRRYKRGER